MSEPIPPTRWEAHLAGPDSGYARTFEALIEQGEDIHGEARLADLLAPRQARILDAGSGMGRVAAELQRRGHRVCAVEKDPHLVEHSRRRFPGLPVVACDILGATPRLLAQAGQPGEYDVIVLVGNVMVYLADDTEVRALRVLRDLLHADGRILVGFHPRQGPAHSRDYPFEEFGVHVAEAGLAVAHRFGTYDLRPQTEDYVVAVLTHASA